VVKHLATGAAGTGFRLVTWDGRDERGSSVAAGTYFVRMSAPSGVTTKRLVVIR
jgi:flagellar hook assembly protein FlgD